MKSVLSLALAAALAAGPALADDIILHQLNLAEDGVLTLGDLEQMRREIFETFDADGDGALDSSEYTAFDQARAAAAETTGSPLHRRAVHGLARERTDLNLDGRVTREEFREALTRWFHAQDTDKSGTLSRGDF